MRLKYLLLFIVLFAACKPGRKVSTSFYYWKTVYKQNAVEGAYLKQLHVNKLYVRIMDIDMDDDGITPVPISPITFQDKVADSVQVIPIVFIVNDVLRNISKAKMDNLARKLYHFANEKVVQSGKPDFNELQIDCDWTAETRDNYFYLLKQLRIMLPHKILSVTLRLHQIKNQVRSGIPPADKVLLMCYNMGNLRKYGSQNSIIELSELKKYIGDNLSGYPMAMDVGLPLFSWAVAFRNTVYIGIDKRINLDTLNRQNQFASNSNNMYTAKTDLPGLGLQKGDEIRWEAASLNDVEATAGYIARFLRPGDVGIVWFHLDENLIKKYTYEGLENTAHLLR